MTNKELIQKFYTSFSNADIKGMLSCYHDDITFTDPAFGTLQGNRAKAMWQMLLSRSNGGTQITFNSITTNKNKGSVHWKAVYTYGSKKRKVTNNITANFTFLDGKIIEHVDTFNLWNWSKQALGISGYLLGWSSFFKSKIQTKTNNLLDTFISSSKNTELK
ncbi:MAG: nuclear transport factor 2 family protein [Cellulophaga sp.]|uniref:nuclear transport factor 2 family protein n=1 Tax=unclassified Cellulophaga TaxID=2634405 RepID=UPI000C2B98BB|nr:MULTISPECIES: nuclear transport factor 2 family protein [unclassified Cellulophaga]MDO6492994.1 nuclear transport factor 2 family protein [Cellulophaga sp. 2_MG-2023]MDO6496188.1 nuclear transport factor 2 family protein [Cellulophaga sp. 3_MG-2023]PKB43326.1 ketosteroid isomerase-like protein [Cellulophaga sp. RHA19]